MHAVTTVSLPAILTDGRAHKSMTEAHCLQHSHLKPNWTDALAQNNQVKMNAGLLKAPRVKVW